MTMKESNNEKKLVLFYYKKQDVAGSLIYMLNIAKYLAENKKYDKVYYVNIQNKILTDLYGSHDVIHCDVESCDYGEFEGADFFVPVNYIYLLLEKIKNLNTGKILLYSWQPHLFRYLSNQYYIKHKDDLIFSNFIKEKDALAFMDESCRLSTNNIATIDFPKNYIPVNKSSDIFPFESLPIVNNKHINIGWLGRLDSDKIYALLNLIDNLFRSELADKIDLHIIGDGECRNKIDIKKYSPKIRFIFTSYLYGEIRDQYIKENIDIMVTMGMSTLDTANLSVPVVIAPLANKAFKLNKYVYLFDTKDYSLGWDIGVIDKLDYPTYTMDEIISDVYFKNRKTELAYKCYSYGNENFSIERSAEDFLIAMNNCKLTISDCFSMEVIKQQFSDYELYKKIRPHRDYFAYIEFIGKLNKAMKSGKIGVLKYGISFAKGKILNKLKLLINLRNKTINKFKRKINASKSKRVHLRKYLYAQESYREKIKNIRQRATDGKPIKVAHFVIFSSVFQSEPVFQQMLVDPCFDPYIIVTPDMQRSQYQKITQYEQTYGELIEKYGVQRVISGFDATTGNYYDPGDEYPIVFFNNPYSRMAYKWHHVTYFLDKDVLTLYPYYGFAAVKYGRNLMKTDFYNYVWKLCLDSELNRKDLNKYQPIHGKNALVCGYLKMDRLADVRIVERKRKKIIISPHHTVLGWKSLDISNFMKYFNFFLELPKRYPDIDFVFRPHPLLFSNLRENKIWTEDEINNYLAEIEEIPNIEYDKSGDYFDLFMNSDAMIHDCSSFIGEYLFTEKPCCYMLKNTRQINEVLLPMGKECMKQYYKAFNETDIIKFIDEVVVAGKDPLKQQRETFSRNKLKFNYPNGAKSVVDYIKHELQLM